MNYNLDIALVGNNYFTYLLSLGLLKKGKKVLILDDERFNYGEKFSETLSYLDIEFLKQWGNEFDIAPLKNIESYIEIKPYTLVIGRKQILLGRAPSENLRELKRKFSVVFNSNQDFNTDLHKEEIDHLFYLTASDLSRFLLKDFKNKNLIDFIDNQIEDRIKEDFNFFFQSFFKAEKGEFTLEQKNDFHALIFTMRGYFQNRLGLSAHKTESFHLFLNFLSPHYKLNHKKLIQDLLELYKNNGGVLKQVDLDELNSGPGFVQRFALESFDGMIRPKKMLFIGGYPNNLPIKLQVKKRASYQCLKVKAIFKKKIPDYYLKKSYIFSSPIKIGTDRPYWQVEFSSAKEANFYVVMNQKEGSKVEFLKTTIEKVLTDDLNYIFAELDAEIVSSQMSFTLDILVDDKNAFSYKNKDREFQKTTMNPFSHSQLPFVPKVKNALYFGPYYDSWLGRYSSLVELRRWKENL